MIICFRLSCFVTLFRLCVMHRFLFSCTGLVYHIPQALENFRFLPDIGASQVERKNYDQRCAYFTSTSRGGGAYNKTVTQQVSDFIIIVWNYSLPLSDRLHNYYLESLSSSL